ncbi:unnamed protein product [Schistosoma intercalatum]|nr:unnamed protein product [Schistosoma intercalatum]CAH8496737.1 unnamed protein product [Schistosoma intercalatum]
MLQAIYPYEGPFPGTLKFSRDEIFLDIREENEYWRLVSKTDGTLGCVPTNFVKRYEAKDEDFVQQLAKKALANLTANSSEELQGKEDLVKRLLQISKRKPDESTALCGELSGLKISAPEKPVTMTGTVGLIPGKPSPAKQSIGLPKNFESCLVDTIRLGTNCSYADCRSVYYAIVDLLSTIPELKQNFQGYNSTSYTVETELDYSRSPDWYLLKIKLGYFESRQSNDQECNWGLHEDSHEIVERLNELNTLLEKADPKLVVCYLHSVKFLPVLSLVGLYQRETRNEIRSKLLRSVGILCSLDASCIRICLGSVLPTELIRELRGSSPCEIPHLAIQLRFLSILISQSQTLPVDLYTSLDQELFTHLINLCDTSKQQSNLIDLGNHSPSNQILITDGLDPFEQNGGQYYMFSYAVALFLLACNWHFCSVYALNSSETSSPNSTDTKTPLLKALLAKPVSSRLFLEIIIQTFNRHLDPIFMVTFLPNDKNCDSANNLTQWASFARFDATWTTSSEKNLEDFIKKFEANSYLRKNTHNDLEYIQSLWTHNVGQTAELDSKPVLPVNASLNTPNDSVVKFLCDLFSYSDTGALIYQNDLDVIIGVINRRIRDEPNSEHLPHLLLLLNLICINANIANKSSLKINDTMEILAPLSQASLSPRCKTLAIAAHQQIKSVICSPDRKY